MLFLFPEPFPGSIISFPGYSKEKKHEFSYRFQMCNGQGCREILGMVIPLLIGILIMGITPTIGLMSLSPIIWKCHGSWSTRPDRTNKSIKFNGWDVGVSQNNGPSKILGFPRPFKGLNMDTPQKSNELIMDTKKLPCLKGVAFSKPSFWNFGYPY